MIKDPIIKCDICGKELSLNGYPHAWEDIKRTHMQSYSTWEGYDTEEQICSACWLEAFGEKKDRKTIKDRIKEYDTTIKDCKSLKDSLEQEKANLSNESLKIRQLLSLGFLEFDGNTININLNKCRQHNINIGAIDTMEN